MTFALRLWRFIFLWMALGALGMPGLSAETDAHVPLQAQVILEGKDQLVLQLKIDEGWTLGAEGNTFSKPPKVSWAGSGVIAARWPKPEIEDKQGFKVPVYKGTVRVPITFDVEEDIAGPYGLLVEAVACSETECRPVELGIKLGSKKVWAHIDAIVAKAAEKAKRSTANTKSLPAKKPGFFDKHTKKANPLFRGVGGGLWLLLAAFLGGLVLNVMPCVLPVLGVKLMIFAKRTCPKGTFPAFDLWMSAFGIYVAFLALALVAIVLKFLGQSAGWGLHFQSRPFLAIMTMVLTLFLANVLEWFEIGVPKLLQAKSGRLMHGSRAFLTGVLSVALATPCTAPFVGTAVGFAVSQSPFLILTVFSFVAAGFAAPYWIAALLPSHHLRLPKPGPWLLWVRRILGALLLMTLGWMIFLLSALHSLWFTGILVSFIALTLWGFFLNHRKIGAARGLIITGFLGIYIAATQVPFTEPEQSTTAPADDCAFPLKKGLWQAFRPDCIDDLVDEGRTVLVDVTARWCLNCKLNKRLVYDDPDVQKTLENAFKEKKLVCMQADWTQPNDEIKEFLAFFDKAGIPFTVVFGPGAPDGLVLPEVFSASALFQALSEASKQTIIPSG